MTRRMKTEYMRMFTGPRWDTYGSCYRDLVQYRGLRRLLEQAHRPWVWTGWDSGSASGSGASTPPPDQCCSATRLLAPGAQPETAAEPCRAQPQPPDRPRTQPEVQPGAHPQPQPPDRPRTQAGAQPEAQAGVGQRSGAAEFHCSAKEIIVQGNQRDKRHDQAKGDLCGSRRVKSASLEKSLKPSQASPAAVVTKETKAPFAMYGWAEKEVEVGCKKTYNVGASALRGQIYESAVRAQDRRQVQRAMRVSRTRGTEPRTNCAADHQTFQNHETTSEHSPVGALPSVGVVPSAGDDDPWLSEYMRCFSTRSI